MNYNPEDLLKALEIKNFLQRYISKHTSGKRIPTDVIASSDWSIYQKDGVETLHIRFIRWVVKEEEDDTKFYWVSEALEYPLSDVLKYAETDDYWTDWSKETTNESRLHT